MAMMMGGWGEDIAEVKKSREEKRRGERRVVGAKWGGGL